MLDAELKAKINLLWDKSWSRGISNPSQGIEQTSYLIFMKRLEDEDVKAEQNSRLIGGKYVYRYSKVMKIANGRNRQKWPMQKCWSIFGVQSFRF
jgi:hypothetical protein